MIRFYFAASVDGFIAREDGDLSWLTPYQASELGFEQFLKGVEVVVMGRRTFDVVRGWNAWPYGTIRGVVLSSVPVESPFPNVVWWNQSFAQLLAWVRGGDILGDVWVEGGQTMAAFLEAGAVDCIDMFTIPLVLGAGIPAFGRGRKHIPLGVPQVETFGSGVVKHTYVLPPPG